MITMPKNRPLGVCALLAALILTALSASAQTARERMWPAPTAEDWKKPVGITFQRTWEDALAVSKATGKPILICINMDGEIASEHYAGIRYRQPEIYKLYEPYVCVIASTYRHTPHDHDENGERILCPRFGSVTCGEHISIEPILFEKFMEGQRVAPRHIMVELDGKESYDIFYANDTQSVFQAIEDGINNRKLKPKPQVKGDRTLVEKVASPDVKDRTEVESAFKNGDKETKTSLLKAALAMGEKAPAELLRLGLFGFDEDLTKMARDGLKKSNTKGTTDLIAEALSVPLNDQEKTALLSALDRLGQTDPRARRLAQVQRGLSTASEDVKTDAFRKAVTAGATYKPASEADITGALRDQNNGFSSKEPTKRLALARAFLAKALEQSAGTRSEQRIREALFADACEAANATLEIAQDNWGAHAVLAVSHYYTGAKEKAYAAAEKAAKLTPDEPQSRDAMIVMGLVAEKRRTQISDSIRDKKDWPRSWLRDLHAAYDVLADHPFGQASQVTMHYDFLMWLGAWGKANSALKKGMKRFPNSWDIHDRFRTRILRRYGVSRLESSYERLLKAEDAHKNLPWYAGYASLVTAEFHRRAGKFDKALAAYKRGIAHYEKAIANDEKNKKTSDHYISMAHGGEARIYLELKKDQEALDAILASLKRSEGSAATLDGLNISTVDTAKMLRSRLWLEKKENMALQLEAALKKLSPELLKLPAYEFGPPKKK